MCAVADVDFLFCREKVSDYVFRAEAVAYPTDFLAVVFCAHGDEAGIDDRIDDWRGVGNFLVRFLVVTFEPGLDVEVAWSIEGNGVTVEQIWHHHEISIGSELVGLDGA